MVMRWQSASGLKMPKKKQEKKKTTPKSGEFKKMFCFLAGWLCWLCLPCCAAGEFNVSFSDEAYFEPEITTSVIHGQLDALPGPPRAPIVGLAMQPWVQQHGDVTKYALVVVDAAWADFVKLCTSIADLNNAKGLGCQRVFWHCEWLTPKLLWCGLFVSGLGGTYFLFKILGWFSRIWGFDFLPLISVGIAVVNLYIGFWILDTDDPFFNFLCWIVWGIVGASWPVRSDTTCLAHTARPRKTKKKRTKRKGTRNETRKRLHVDPFCFYGPLLCKIVCIATKVGSVRHKGSRGKHGSRVKTKGFVPLRWLNCQGDTLTNDVEFFEDWKVAKEKIKTHHPRSLKSKWQEIALLSKFSGGAGGSAASNRIRQEKELLEGLKQLLGGLNSQGRGRERSRSPSPHPPPRSRSPSPGWITKGKGKKKGNGKTQTKTKTAEDPSSPGPRRVTWENDSLDQNSLLAELKALILQTEVHRGTGPSLISELQKLVSKYSTPSAEVPPNNFGKRTVAPWNSNPKKENSSHLIIKPCPQWWPKITTQKEFVEALDLGEIPKESAAVIGTFDQFLGWKQLASTHQIKDRFAVICQDITDPGTAAEKESCEFKWLKLHNGVWKKFGVMPLSEEGMPQWPTEPKKLDGCEKGSEEKALATFRVLIPKRFVTASTWEVAVKKPIQLLAGALPDGLAFRSYGWHRNQDTKEEAILGFVKIPLEEKDVPGSRSGWNSVLFQPILDSQQNRQDTPIKWIPCTQKSSVEYFQEVKRQAQNKKVGIAIRRGGKNCLGLLGVKDESCPAELVRRRWIARYVPVHWNPQQFLEILQTKGWRTIEEIQPPSHKGGLWCFKAAPPPGCGEACEMSVGNGKSVVFSPWFPKRPQPPKTVPLKPTFKGWVANGPASNQLTEAVVQHDQKKDEIGDTQLDPPTQQDVEMCDGTQKRGAEDSPEKPAAKTPKLSSPQKGKGSSSLGPNNCQIWDLGGHGNCGFRCLAATMAIRNKKPLSKYWPKLTRLHLVWGQNVSLGLRKTALGKILGSLTPTRQKALRMVHLPLPSLNM